MLPSKESTSTLNDDKLNNITEPYQPTDIVFPQREIGGVKRRFSPAWYKTFPWIHYDANSDSVFCFTCIKAARVKAISSTKKEEAFTTRGFSNWKKAMSKDGLKGHEISHSHKEATLRILKAPVEYKNVGSSLSEEFRMEQLNNRKMFLKILSNIRYLGKTVRTTLENAILIVIIKPFKEPYFLRVLFYKCLIKCKFFFLSTTSPSLPRKLGRRICIRKRFKFPPTPNASHSRG